MAKYSIIIPTRERPQTLEYAIKSALSIPREDIEVIISDNCSSIETEHIVKKFDDKRLVYSRSDQRLPMTANFERGISLSTGDYVTVIGDDDCIIPSVFGQIEKQLQTRADVVYWFRYPYFWNNSPESPGLLSGSFSSHFQELPINSLLEKSLTNFFNYQFLPSFYNSWVSKSVINKIINFNQINSLSSSIYLDSVIAPDVYSALLISLFTDNCLYSSSPFSLSGISSFSNGMGIKHNNRDSKLFLQEYGCESHKQLCHEKIRPFFDFVELISTISNTTLVSLTIASDYFVFLEHYHNMLNIDENKMMLAVFQHLQYTLNFSSSQIVSLQQKLNLTEKEFICLTNSKLNKSDFRLSQYKYLHKLYGVPKPKEFTVDTRKWQVSNCFDAMVLYENILNEKSPYKKFLYTCTPYTSYIKQRMVRFQSSK